MYYSRMISKMLSVHLQMVHVSDACLSDYYKDAHGFRPRHYKLWWSYDELDAEIEYLSKVAEENYKAECAREEKALKALYILQCDSEPPRTHDLSELLNSVEKEWSKESSSLCESLNRFSVEARYSDPVWSQEVSSREYVETFLKRTEDFVSYLLE